MLDLSQFGKIGIQNQTNVLIMWKLKCKILIVLDIIIPSTKYRLFGVKLAELVK